MTFCKVEDCTVVCVGMVVVGTRVRVIGKVVTVDVAMVYRDTTSVLGLLDKVVMGNLAYGFGRIVAKGNKVNRIVGKVDREVAS